MVGSGWVKIYKYNRNLGQRSLKQERGLQKKSAIPFLNVQPQS